MNNPILVNKRAILDRYVPSTQSYIYLKNRSRDDFVFVNENFPQSELIGQGLIDAKILNWSAK